MPIDPLVLELLEEVEAGKTPEEACADHPGLLEEVRARLERVGRVCDELDALFPEPAESLRRLSVSRPSFTPDIPGHAIESVLGRGGMGVVYKARNLRLNRPVAVKMMLNAGYAGPPELARFLREAEALAAVVHPNIVRIYEVGDVDGLPFFTMEYVEGETLAERLGGVPITAERASALLEILAGAMQAAHAAGIVHRDLKPANVLMTGDGVPRITDFGLAWRHDTGVALTRTGVRVGTPSYMAPEQAAGHSLAFGPATDIYSLGAILYEALTGRPPFRAATGAETERQVIHDDPVPPKRLNSRVPRDLETICLTCLNKDPRLRYADADALARDLSCFRRGEAIAARPEGGLGRLARRIRRRPAFSAAFVAVLILVTTVILGGLWFLSERLATEHAAEVDIREMVRALERSAWPEAHTALERARGRLGSLGASGRSRALLDRGDLELKLVSRLDAIRLNRVHTVGGVFNTLPSVREYRSAFEEAGLGSPGERPEVVAGRVRASSVRKALVAMLDDWALHAVDNEDEKDWALAVARQSDDHPTGWSQRARDRATWKDRAKLASVLKDAPVADASIPLLLALEEQWNVLGQDSSPFLRRILREHPEDFWVNLRAADVLREKNEFAESARYYQAALAIRPGTALVYNNLAMVLSGAGHREEAVELHHLALRLDPDSAPYHHNLANTLLALERPKEALEHARLAARYFPAVAKVRWLFGRCLEANGSRDEAIREYRRAVELGPAGTFAQADLRTALIRERRFGEAHSAWKQSLADSPSGHDEWYGYAELCLFLGRHEDYRNTRRALLARFGTSDDPIVAERAARACLISPDSEAGLRTAVALGKRAWEADRAAYPGPFPFFQFLRGLADYREGRFDRSIALMEGEASGVLGPAPGLVRSMALHRIGREADAREALATALKSHDWSEDRIRDQDDWIVHILRREALGLIRPDDPGALSRSGADGIRPAP
ncbi:protein kinase domain-containing protein [Aquisphaera insulae]|uniref:serine/threonine-protein kinase n=1 Tax=Aquisphaera insulae TaxID=2712864 RepID=UPI0013ED3DB6|nr:protein kinase [Aquisphaera insulae]